MIDWQIRGREFVNCNCDYGCPCQFNALPTHGDCRAVCGYQIDEGHFGDVKLYGLLAAGMWAWPGAIHEGNGTRQLIVPENADEAQRDALEKIMSGAETDPMSTMWSVFDAMTTTRLETLVRHIEFEVNVNDRTARLVVPGVIDGVGEPIVNPVTGNIHRARIDLPHGFEYELAEMGSGTTRTTGEIELDFVKTYGQFAELHLSNAGVVRQ